MRVLAVDTATFMGTVAVTDGGKLLAETSASVRAAHGETLLPHVRRTLEMAHLALSDLDLLAVGLGPGSFTGVRIGVATIKGLALAEGKPLVGMDSLRVMAAGMLGASAVRVVAVDAYKGEVYAAAYRQDRGEPLCELLAPINAAPEVAAERIREAIGGDTPVALAGDGLSRYPGVLEAALGLPTERAPLLCDAPRAAVLAIEAERHFAAHGADDLAALEPVYVRASDAKLPRQSQQRRPQD